MKKLKNILCALIILIGGIAVIAEWLGPHAYWFNLVYFVAAAICVGVSDWGKTLRPDLCGCTGTSKTNDR